MSILGRIYKVLPTLIREYARHLYTKRKFNVESYRPKDFFESWYKSTSDFHDRYTIGPETGEFRALYHYKSVERSIIAAILNHGDEAWITNSQTLRVLDIGSGTGHWLKFFIDEPK